MTIRICVVFCCLMLLFGVQVGMAQEDTLMEHPLLTLLSFVSPSMALEEGAFLSYIDYDAVFSANGGVTMQTTIEEINAIQQTDVWKSNLSRLGAGANELQRALRLDRDEFTPAYGCRSRFHHPKLSPHRYPYPESLTNELGVIQHPAVIYARWLRGFFEREFVPLVLP